MPTRRKSTGIWWRAAALSTILFAAAGWWLSGLINPEPQKWRTERVTSADSDSRVTAAAISWDGKLLAYADASELWLRVLKTGETYPLFLPPGLRISRVAWFTDNLRLLLSGFSTAASTLQVWTESIKGGEPRLLRQGVADATPSLDGSQLAATANGGSEIWLMGINGESARLFVKGAAGETFPFLFWAAGGQRLSYQRRHLASGRSADHGRDLAASYRWSYESRDIVSGKEMARQEGIQFESASVASSGRMIYLRTNTAGNKTPGGIWEVQTNPANGAFISAPRELADIGEAKVRGLSAAGDGKEASAIVESGQADVYVADLEKPGPRLAHVRRLTSDLRTDYPHAWTQDSQSVIFESNREGTYRLYRQRLDRIAPEKLPEMAGHQVLPQLAPDGGWLLYALLNRSVSPASNELYPMRLNGGNPVQVPLNGTLDEFRCPLLKGSCVLRETLDRRQYVYYALDPIMGKGEELARTAWIPSVVGDWALSPDGKTVAIPYHDSNNPRIRLVPLDTAATGRSETEIQVHTPAVLWGLNWSQDSAGWFAELRKSGNIFLVYIDARGQTHDLRSTPYDTWGDPSPDGKKLAFVDYAADWNVWIWSPR